MTASNVASFPITQTDADVLPLRGSQWVPLCTELPAVVDCFGGGGSDRAPADGAGLEISPAGCSEQPNREVSSMEAVLNAASTQPQFHEGGRWLQVLEPPSPWKLAAG